MWVSALLAINADISETPQEEFCLFPNDSSWYLLWDNSGQQLLITSSCQGTKWQPDACRGLMLVVRKHAGQEASITPSCQIGGHHQVWSTHHCMVSQYMSLCSWGGEGAGGTLCTPQEIIVSGMQDFFVWLLRICITKFRLANMYS